MIEDWVLALAATPWVYVVMVLFATIDGFFPPIPSESVVIALAALAMSTGQPIIGWVILAAALGAFCGDQIAFTIGRHLPIHKLPFMRGEQGQKILDTANRELARRGASYLFAARFVPVGRVAVNMTAGYVGFPRRRFVTLVGIAAVMWALFSTLLGVSAGAALRDRPLLAVVVGVIAGVLLGYVVDWALGKWYYSRQPSEAD
jgi:membrane-associated protein